jgi:iron(III) transport system substrate-binding protein
MIHRSLRFLFVRFAPILLASLTAACRPAEPSVVVYTSLDAAFSEPILDEFTARTGIKVLAVTDTEAQKTTGLAGRLIAERGRPRCDVYWNNEIVQTVRLKQEGLFEPYFSPSAETIPARWKDPEGEWTGFAARARVIAFNTDLVALSEVPRTLTDLNEPQWKGRVGIAFPIFGTTATHAATIFAMWGELRAESFFNALKRNEARVYDGNMSAARAVADGEIALCLTDTDDVNVLALQGKPIGRVLIDHYEAGGLMIPNTISLVRRAPNPDNARKLIDYLLSPEVEMTLAASPSAQIPLHAGAQAPEAVRDLAEGPFLQADFALAAAELARRADWLAETFARN